MLAGVVYVYTVKALLSLCTDWNVSRLYLHSFIAKLPETFAVPQADVHVLAGLTSFANAVKLACYGNVGDRIPKDVAIENRRTLIQTVNDLWKPASDRAGNSRIHIIHGIVSDYLPPIEAIVPIDNAIKSKAPDDLFPVRNLLDQ